MIPVLPLTPAELAAARRAAPLHGDLLAVVTRAEQALDTFKRGEHLTGRSLVLAMTRLEAAIAVVRPPAPPPPPEWRPDV